MPITSQRISADAKQARFGLQIAALLNQGAAELPAAVDARLRQIRIQALQQQSAPQRSWLRLSAGRVGMLGAERPGWRLLLGLALALPVLVLGLQLVQARQEREALHQLADVDTALLLDDVPPQAYLDPGFRSYLGQGN